MVRTPARAWGIVYTPKRPTERPLSLRRVADTSDTSDTSDTFPCTGALGQRKSEPLAYGCQTWPGTQGRNATPPR
jgi:hypothetical protein